MLSDNEPVSNNTEIKGPVSDVAKKEKKKKEVKWMLSSGNPAKCVHHFGFLASQRVINWCALPTAALICLMLCCSPNIQPREIELDISKCVHNVVV